MKYVGITGGTGLVGRHLCRLLAADGYELIVFTRNPGKNRKYIKNTTYAEWNPRKKRIDTEKLTMVEAMVHLAGESLADKRWTEQRKTDMVDSRVMSTQFLVEQVKQYAPSCKVFVSASAIGYYGADDGRQPFTEDLGPATDFLGHTCRLWEAASEPLEEITRRVILRLGIVLAKEGGAFYEFAKPVKFGVMPVLGSGDQVVSWIHVQDVARMVRFAIERGEVSGIYNAVAPSPVTHLQLMRAIAKTNGGLRIPVPVPGFALRLVLGEMAGEVLKSATVSAGKIMDKGFKFHFSEMEDAVKDLLSAPVK